MAFGRALLVGFAVTNEAVARQLVRRGTDVAVLDDNMSDALRERVVAAGCRVAGSDDPVSAVDVVIPSPGVPVAHPVVQRALSSAVPVWSEFELAAHWDDRPIVAVTGTNGKTTVTTLVTSMLAAAGRRVVSAGNNELPLVDAIDDPAIELFVVEASSFRLQFTTSFRPVVAAWLNFAADHLDWHATLEGYAEAKARIWAAQGENDLAVANAEDAVVLGHARRAPGRVTTFGLADGDVRIRDGQLCDAGGRPVVAVDELPRSLPHDLANAAAAVACASGAEAPAEACAGVLRSFRGLPHRMQFVGEAGGVRWYDDSKATTPASVVAAVSGFDSAVLIAGGRNKGLDLGELRRLAGRLRAVVAIGEAAPLVEAVFGGRVPVCVAGSMDEAVALAGAAARPGDSVVLSPGCASYDWYRNYGERGDDFARAVLALTGAGS